MLLSNLQATVVSLYKPPQANPPHLIAEVPDSPKQMPAASPQAIHVFRPSPQIARVVSSPLQGVSAVRPVQRSLFATLPDNQPEILGYLKEISERQKQLAEQQRQTQERLDALIAVLSGQPEQPNVPVLPTCTSSVTPDTPDPVTPVTPLPTLSVPDLDSQSACPSQSVEDDVIFQLRSKSTSEKNFSVQLLRHIFTPCELEGRNVRGVGGKLPLNPEKICKIKEILFRFFPASLSQQELLWRDCRKAIDAYLRNRKAVPDRSQ